MQVRRRGFGEDANDLFVSQPGHFVDRRLGCAKRKLAAKGGVPEQADQREQKTLALGCR